MKKFLLALPLMLAACQTVPDESAVETAVHRAVIAEGLLAARCAIGAPSYTEWQAVISARMLFAARYRALMTAEQMKRYDTSIDNANLTCSRTAPYMIAPTN